MTHKLKERVRKLNQAESIRQKFLRYGLTVASVAKDAWIIGGRKGLRKFVTKMDFKLKV